MEGMAPTPTRNPAPRPAHGGRRPLPAGPRPPTNPRSQACRSLVFLELSLLFLLCLPLSSPRLPAQDPPNTGVVVHDGPVYGIDVSHHQGLVDWARVARSGHRFTFIKATEGLDWSDPRFAVNWRDSGYAGLLRGAYHFFHADDDADLQADAFLAVYRPSPGDLPPVVDVEVADDVEPAVLAAGVQRFLERLERATGTTPLLYTAPRFWDDLGVEAPAAPLWVAEYGVHSPDLPRGWQGWAFWQESRRGRIPGVPGEVDLNVFAGPLHELAALTLRAIPKPLPSAVPEVDPGTPDSGGAAPEKPDDGGPR